jgi:hypothetical protein
MTPQEFTIRSQAELESAWRTLLQPLGFDRSTLWMMLIGPDDRPLPRVVEIEDADEPPTDETMAGFAHLLEHLREELLPEGRFAFLRSRPGAGGITSDDRAWATALYAAARRAGVPIEVVHRANDVDVLPLPLDELRVA